MGPPGSLSLLKHDLFTPENVDDANEPLSPTSKELRIKVTEEFETEFGFYVCVFAVMMIMLLDMTMYSLLHFLHVRYSRRLLNLHQQSFCNHMRPISRPSTPMLHLAGGDWRKSWKSNVSWFK